MNVVTTCKIRRDIREHLVSAYPEISFQFCEDITEAEPFIHEAEVLLTYGEDLHDSHIDKASKLKWIMVLSAGLDEMPFHKIEEKGIIVSNVKGIHSIPMAEYAISMLLQVSRQAKTVSENERLRRWDKKVRMTEITGKTMLIAGAGAIGQEVARLAKAFRMKTIGISNSGREKDFFDEVHTRSDLMTKLAEADFVISVLPSTPETKGFFAKEHFEQMPSDAVFLNMGRGDAVHDHVMLEVMQEQLISHAILDVFEQEPLPEAHPFWGMYNVTVTPHISGVSPDYQPRGIEIFEHNLKEYRNGTNDYLNKINPRKGY
ncbi:D-2-hydroxyacid dehydrogenase [Pontibacillus yanchengensis]|uniref:D-2-hydroxyacid dehydrogenase n=1 Tax=Pontibacillus yanchengensis TaxID=462910 RepID=A0ACC7VIX3_9BACI|nr:D-2-hydroxyacid dehydrogenase [Pontibacillus yanchengensis]MYL54911.1 D-2-hydroxyacid dehydrogenase [Pontibacillus yanchengensis]